MATQMASLAGYVFLSKEATVTYLQGFVQAQYSAGRVLLPEVVDLVHPAQTLFPPAEINTFPTRVWRYSPSGGLLSLLRCGLVVTNKTVLNTDYWTTDSLLDAFAVRSRSHRHTPVIVAPLGHYFDGSLFVGYYDFMFLVAAKFCRLKETASETEWQQALISYPLLETTYERDFFTAMGVSSERLIDSRQTRLTGDVCYVGNHDNWTHPNPTDVFLLKKHLGSAISTPRKARNRVYISRAGRRRVRNEAALIALLKTYDFQIIEDRPRSLAEQYAIYHNASFIMGPHGASFTNVLWCTPGTHLFELFDSPYAPRHFQYLAHLLGLHYTAYSKDPIGPVDYTAIAQNIDVSIADLKQRLDLALGR